MPTYTFRKMQTYRERRFTCEVCGRRAVRKQTFWQTVSPFNRREDGTPKTPQEVLDAVQAQADAWWPTRHEKCEGEPVPTETEENKPHE